MDFDEIIELPLAGETNNDMFEQYSKYFRNALVRANYQNLDKDIPYTMEYLNKFFGNLLLGEKNILDNRDMLVKEITKSSDIQESKEKILQAIANNPYITTAELSQLTGLSINGIEKI